jgi:hypothetical protein
MLIYADPDHPILPRIEEGQANKFGSFGKNRKNDRANAIV